MIHPRSQGVGELGVDWKQYQLLVPAWCPPSNRTQVRVLSCPSRPDMYLAPGLLKTGLRVEVVRDI